MLIYSIKYLVFFFLQEKYAQGIEEIKEKWANEKAEEDETFSEVLKCMEEAQTLLKLVKFLANRSQSNDQNFLAVLYGLLHS